MARPRRRPREEPAGGGLFPFLSVLACVIGALSLLIAALALGAVTDDDERATRMAYASLLAELEVARAERARLGLRLEEARQDQSAAARAARELAALEARIDELEGERGGLLDLLERLREALAAVPPPSEEEPRILVQPAGREDRTRRPYFVECNRESLLLYATDNDLNFVVHERELQTEFARFLRAAKNRRNAEVFFLVRPDGVELFSRAADMARRLGVRHAKLPIPGEGRVDLRLLSRDEAGG